MHNRYTESARRAVFFARCEASQLGSPKIRTEHLLFGIGEQSAGAVKRHLHIEMVDLNRQLATKPLGAEPPPGPWIQIVLDREVKQVIGYAIDEAKRLGDQSIEAEHLLLGILREEGCVAARALRTAGAPSLADVRRSISESR